MDISKIKAIGFDWDGTLVDSMGVKSQNFSKAVIKFYPSLKEKRKEIKNLYLTTRGNLRIYQLALVQKKYNLNQLSNEKVQKWSDLFTSLYINEHLPLFNDTKKVLDELKHRNYAIFLCSSVPQNDLDKTLKLYPLENYFEVVLGTRDDGKFRKGIPHLTFVSEKIGISLDKIAFIGDAADDVNGANEAECFSVGKIDSRIFESKKEIEKSNPKLTIRNLEELLIHFN